MEIQRIIGKGITKLKSRLYSLLDNLYVPIDQTFLRRARNIRLIPKVGDRRGGKFSYAEWAYVIGVFQTLMFIQLKKKENNQILDIGCGTGLLAIASEPFLEHGGKYIGLDVMKKDIDFCRKQYPPENFEFIHFNVANPAYSPEQTGRNAKWPIENESIDLATALSVWTHLNEEDAIFYFREIERVLKPKGIAIITFFLMDEAYEASLGARTSGMGKYHMTDREQWIFDQPAYGSNAWFHPKWVKVPENAIGITKIGLERLCENSELKLVEHCQGNWKEVPGMLFQDVLIFQKF